MASARRRVRALAGDRPRSESGRAARRGRRAAATSHSSSVPGSAGRAGGRKRRCTPTEGAAAGPWEAVAQTATHPCRTTPSCSPRPAGRRDDRAEATASGSDCAPASTWSALCSGEAVVPPKRTALAGAPASAAHWTWMRRRWRSAEMRARLRARSRGGALPALRAMRARAGRPANTPRASTRVPTRGADAQCSTTRPLQRMGRPSML